jgi:class 3 adenylate cyclase/tetratricopeptide (TPR) repeat protein
VAESVELATILLTDLVGSTRLATTVGPVRADQLREEHFGLLRDALASSAGKEVKNTGDGLMVAFPSASEAVTCAVAMQQAFERRYRDAEQALHIRIGLGAGESTVKDGDYFGMPSIEAARLCAQAPADGILISALVQTLAGRCQGVEFASAGELELKGIPDPVQAFAVSWAPLADETRASSRWPLPALLRSVPVVSYVGRAEERAALEEALNLARSGQRQIVLLSGEPGIGKTRLASYAAHHAHSEGAAVLWGACTEELAVPYEPWIQIATHVVEHAPQELLERHVERHKGEVGRVARNLESRVPDLPAPQSSDPETERYLLFNAVTGLLGEAAEAVPLCVVLDDLHWADAQSLALLKHLLRTHEQGSLQLIATFRDSELGKDHPLTGTLADMRRLEGVQRIALHGLGADEVAEIMTAVAGHELPADAIDLAAQIAAETDGNPFFVGEILRGLSESGALVFDEDAQRWSIDRSAGIALPESVREVIERRVERLDPQATELLRQAAVIGRVFSVDLLSACSDLTEGPLLDHLESAVAASLLSESTERVGEFRFVHALIDQTLYDGMGGTRRARMHLRVAEALEELYGANPDEHLAELALHWRLAAVSVDKAKAADYARRAGQHALESLAPDEAAKLFTDALELTGDVKSADRCEVMISLGEAQRQSGNPTYRETLLAAAAVAEELGDTDGLCRAVLAMSRGFWARLGAVDYERVQALEAATKALPVSDVRRARVLAQLAIELHHASQPERCRALAAEALEIARAAGDPGLLASTFDGTFMATWAPATLQDRQRLNDEGFELAQRLNDPRYSFQNALGNVAVGIEAGERSRVESAVEALRALAASVPEPSFVWRGLAFQGGWAFVQGDLPAAEQLALEAFKVGEASGQPDAVLMFGGALFNIRYQQGRLVELVDGLVHLADKPDRPTIAVMRAQAALALVASGRADEARELARAADFQSTPIDVLWGMAVCSWADACSRLGLRDRALELYELIKPFSGQLESTGNTTWGSFDGALGRLARTLQRYEQAEHHFAAAAEIEERLGAPLLLARTRADWARVLIARGRREDLARAQHMLEQAEEVAEPLEAKGITGDVTECRTALAALSG